jgi:anti-sigma B factor antagonist
LGRSKTNRPYGRTQVLDDSAIRLANCCSMREERHLNALSICLSGQFDLTCEQPFRDELARLLDGEIDTFLLDLRGLRFIDSTGLGVLLQIEALARGKRLDFTVLCGDGQVREVLRTTGLDGVLTVVDLRGGLVPASDSPV